MRFSFRINRVILCVPLFESKESRRQGDRKKLETEKCLVKTSYLNRQVYNEQSSKLSKMAIV